MDRETALGLWDSIFGKGTKWATDPFGTYMYRDDYGERETKRNTRPGSDGKYYKYGWEVDHIKPKAEFANENEATFKNNLEPMWYGHNRDKADNYPNFKIDGKSYKVVRCEICKSNNVKGYGIIDEATGKRIDWKGRQGRYFPTND